MAFSGLSAIFDLLKNNSGDVEDVVNKFGGISAVIKAAPALIRIGQTVAKHKSPDEAAERVERVLYYNDETRAKVEAFQRKHGLTADGIVGNRTWDKIEQLQIKAKTPPDVAQAAKEQNK